MHVRQLAAVLTAGAVSIIPMSGVLASTPTLGSKALIRSERWTSYAIISTAAQRWASPTNHRLVNWSGAFGVIQYYGPHGWTNIKNVYSTSEGLYRYSFNSKPRSYRVVFPNTSTIRGSASASTYR